MSKRLPRQHAGCQLEWLKYMKIIKAYIYSAVIFLTNYFFRLPVAILMFSRMKVRYRNSKIVHRTRGPFLFLPNHANQWDPFLISIVSWKPIRWVASEGLFRDTAKLLLLAIGVIPKIKGQSDMITIEELLRAISLGFPVGIFPEGEQNWDGTTSELIPATAKLVRLLKIPVIVPICKGTYLSKPRWAWKTRRTLIEIHYKRIIDADEIEGMKLIEIERRIKETFKHDEYEWQKRKMAPILSESRAEHLELVHFLCPNCEKIGNLRSRGNTLGCACGYHMVVDRFGFFSYPEGGPVFESPHEWVIWQNRVLFETIKEALDGDDPDPILLRDADITLMKSERAKSMTHVLSGEARLFRKRIEVGVPGDNVVSFPLREISGMNTFKQQKFEFRYRKAQYRLQPPNRSVSGYKWEKACKAVRELLVERGEW